MTRHEIRDEYFYWMVDLVGGRQESDRTSFERLLAHLHNIEFRYLIPKDRNRAEDGKDLRRNFALSNGYERTVGSVVDDLDGPCSVLEMLMALAIRCENSIMDDATRGDRTAQWFWGMIVNLGIGDMTNVHFDSNIVDDAIEQFLDREYEPDGRGGLFRIRDCDYDLRKIEIWTQLCWYLDSIADI